MGETEKERREGMTELKNSITGMDKTVALMAQSLDTNNQTTAEVLKAVTGKNGIFVRLKAVEVSLGRVWWLLGSCGVLGIVGYGIKKGLLE